MANVAILLGLDSAEPPGYEPTGLLGANYSIPLLWLSLFTVDDIVKWPSNYDDTDTYSALLGERERCVARSSERVRRWAARWPDAVGELAALWIDVISAQTTRLLAVWTEDISEMSGDDDFVAALSRQLAGLDDESSSGFREALAQSYLSPGADGLGLIVPGGEPIGLVAAGYAGSVPAPWS